MNLEPSTLLLENGSLALPFPAGTENFCADCHRGASATDFVFTTYERRLGTSR